MKSKVSYTDSDIREIMYGFSLELITDRDYPDILKISIPELGGVGSVPTTTTISTSTNIFVNANKPKVSTSFNVTNYIELPIMRNSLMMGDMKHKEYPHTHSASEDAIYETTPPTEPTHYYKGILISPGDRFIVLFPNKNISNGIILGRG